jgi:hypothetical protein
MCVFISSTHGKFRPQRLSELQSKQKNNKNQLRSNNSTEKCQNITVSYLKQLGTRPQITKMSRNSVFSCSILVMLKKEFLSKIFL